MKGEWEMGRWRDGEWEMERRRDGETEKRTNGEKTKFSIIPFPVFYAFSRHFLNHFPIMITFAE
jgi:hypothetical protein